MSKKMNTVAKQSPHVQKQSDQESSVLSEISTLNKLTQMVSAHESNILTFNQSNELDNSLKKRKLDPPNLRVMSLLSVLESACENLRDNQSPENWQQVAIQTQTKIAELLALGVVDEKNQQVSKVTAIRAVGDKEKLRIVGRLLELQTQGELQPYVPQRGRNAPHPRDWIRSVLRDKFSEDELLLLENSEYWYQVDERIYHILKNRRNQ